MRVTVGYINGEIVGALTKMPCRTCTLFVGWIVSGICASLGIAMFDVPETNEIAGVIGPDAPLPEKPIDPDRLGVDPHAPKIDVETGAETSFTPEQQQTIRSVGKTVT